MQVTGMLVLALVASATAILTDCPDPFEEVLSACYAVTEEEYTWSEANAKCADISTPTGSKGALAHIDSCAQHTALWQYLTGKFDPMEDFWLGATDEDEEGVFRWITTGKKVPMEVPFWFPTQPDGGTDENGLSLSTSGYLADESMTIPQRGVCMLL